MSLLKENIYRTSEDLVRFFDIVPLPGYPEWLRIWNMPTNYAPQEICEKLVASE